MKKYYITGVPGIGKTTLMHELQRRGFAAFDVDYVPGLCHWMHLETREPVEFIMGASEEWHKAHSWVCDETKLENVMNSYDADYLFVCGITKNQEDYFDLFDGIILLHADPEVFMERMAGRDSEHFGYDETDRKSVLTWYVDFEAETIQDGAISVNVDQPVEKTADQILQKLGVV